MKKKRLTIHLSANETPNGYLQSAIARAAAEIFADYDISLSNNRSAHRLFRDGIRDLLIVVGGENANSLLCHQLRSFHRHKIIWYFEDPYELPINVQTARDYDLIFTNDSNCVKQYEGRAKVLMLACEDTGQPRPLKERYYHYSLIASGWPNRLQHYGDISKELNASNARSCVRLVSNPFLDSYFTEYGIEAAPSVGFSEFRRIASISRVSLTINREFSAQSNELGSALTPGPRVFETAIEGAVQVVDEATAETLTTAGFIENEHFLKFENPVECAEILSLAVNDVLVDLQEVSNECYQFVRREHTYQKRLQEIRNEFDTLFAANDDASQIVASCLVPGTEDHRPVALVLAHSTVYSGARAGAEIYLHALVEGLRDKYHFQILAPSRNIDQKVASYSLFDGDNGDLIEEFECARAFGIDELDDEIVVKDILSSIRSRNYQICIVNHNIGIPFSLLEILHSIGLPYIYVCHDYYSICDSYNLLDFMGLHCKIGNSRYEYCNICTYKRRGFEAGAQFRRRAATRDVVARSNAIICNLSETAKLFGRIFSIPDQKFIVAEPPVNVNSSIIERWTSNSTLREEGAKYVAVLGNVVPNKGSRELPYLAELLKEDDIKLVIFGTHDLDSSTMDSAGIVYAGRYDFGESDQVPDLFYQCSAAVFLSPWPETYCLTLEEVSRIGLPSTVPNFDTFVERIENWTGAKVHKSIEEAASNIKGFLATTPTVERLAKSEDVRHNFVETWEVAIRRNLTPVPLNVADDKPLQWIWRKPYASWYATQGREQKPPHTKKRVKPLSRPINLKVIGDFFSLIYDRGPIDATKIAFNYLAGR
ncbi:glycosyltransferase [Roseibium sp.]|uniref:glycosyltransferase family protein n=1 Tax=Roseibium sp. TaxID=1936156 RepID=UPI0039EF3050